MPNQKKIGYRPTWAEVNLNNLAFNFKQIKSRVLKHTKILVTVKADAYGHGLIPVSKKLVSCGVDFLGVASIDEGIKLREAKISTPILILGLTLKKDISAILDYNLTPAVCDFDFVLALNRMAQKRGILVNVHIKVDTGMGRIGVLGVDAISLAEKIKGLRFIRIEGIFTHFPFADLDKEFTIQQIASFNKLITDLKKVDLSIPLVHAANSAGLIDYKESHFTMVRPGLAIYGLYPKKDMAIRLKPVLALKTKIVFIKKVRAGFGLSYGHAYVTKRPGYVATLPIGYGDGYPRNLSNLASVLIKGKRFRISGMICMDQIMIDTGNAHFTIGQEVILIGSGGRMSIRAEELAHLAGTISYEIVCGLGSRIPRLYIN